MTAEVNSSQGPGKLLDAELELMEESELDLESGLSVGLIQNWRACIFLMLKIKCGFSLIYNFCVQNCYCFFFFFFCL